MGLEVVQDCTGVGRLRDHIMLCMGLGVIYSV